MLLALNLGNTNLTAGLFDRRRLFAAWKVPADASPAELRVSFEKAGATRSSVGAIVIASVVPRLNGVLERTLRGRFKPELLRVTHRLDLGFRVHYRPASSLGADRLAAAAAVVAARRLPAIIVDFGTALTFSAVSQKSGFMGGVIAPGPGIGRDALRTRTAKLPTVTLERQPRVTGRDTRSAIRSGLFHGTLGAVEHIVKNLVQELRLGHPAVIATGGLAPLFFGRTPVLTEHHEHLVLHGLRVLHELNRGPNSLKPRRRCVP